MCKSDEQSTVFVQNGSRRVFRFSESGVQEGNTGRPTPKWLRPMRSLRRSYQRSALRLLLGECGSLFPRILEILRTRKRPPQARSELCLSDHRLLCACSRDMTRLQEDYPWQGYSGAQLAFEAWVLGAEASLRISNNSESDKAQTASSVVSARGNDYMQPSEIRQDSTPHRIGFTEQPEKKENQ
jgi:hypothetical protein